MALTLLLLCGQFGSGLFPESRGTEDDVAMQEQVEYLLAHPFDVNCVSAQDLLLIPWLEPRLAHRVTSYRDSLGGFARLEQLQVVPGMDPETYRGLLPFLSIRRRGRQGPRGSFLSRVAVDSVPAGVNELHLFNRLETGLGRGRMMALTEKDRGESSPLDFGSAAAELELGSHRVVLGDFAVGWGLGLLFSAPPWRSSLLNGPRHSLRSVRLLSSAAEAAYLRGLAGEVSLGDWKGLALASYAGRDARLNDDGQVERLVRSGVHSDSLALAGRNAVHERTLGLGLERKWRSLSLGFGAGYSGYDRVFAPRETSGSLLGTELLTGSAHAGLKLGCYSLGAELCGAGRLRLAGAIELKGDWPNWDARLAVRGRQAGCFAPHGRWPGLTGTRDRLDASLRLAWRDRGSGVSFSGNTYRDFELDSLPAQVNLRLSQQLSRLDLALALGLRYRGGGERHRATKAEVGVRLGRLEWVRFVLADVKPATGRSRGVLAGLRIGERLGPAELGLSAARCFILGPGVTMYLSEPGAGRIGAGYSTGVSCWRLAAGIGLRVGEWLRLGLKVGWAWAERARFDGGVQLELSIPGPESGIQGVGYAGGAW